MKNAQNLASLILTQKDGLAPLAGADIVSTIDFDRSEHLIRLLGSGAVVLAGPFDGYNNVDSHSQGPWPDGVYTFVAHNTHASLSDPDSEYGAYGILIFNVPGRVGMGVHSGRQDIPDGLGRAGAAHCTLGCIRTTDEAMAAFLAIFATDAITTISVRTVSDEDALEWSEPSRTRKKPARIQKRKKLGEVTPKRKKKSTAAHRNKARSKPT